MKDFKYYKTVNVPYPSRDEFVTVFVYSQGQVLWTGPLNEYKNMTDRFQNCVIEKVANDEGLKAARAAYGAEASRLEQEFKNDLFEYHGVTENPKANKCYSIAYDYGHHAGHSEVASYFDTLVDLIKD